MGTHVSGSHIRYQVLQSSLQRQRAPRTVTAEWRRVSDFPGNFLRTVKGCVWFLLSDSHLGFLGLTALFRNLEPCFLVIVSQTKTKSSHRPLKVIKGHILGGGGKRAGISWGLTCWYCSANIIMTSHSINAISIVFLNCLIGCSHLFGAIFSTLLEQLTLKRLTLWVEFNSSRWRRVWLTTFEF